MHNHLVKVTQARKAHGSKGHKEANANTDTNRFCSMKLMTFAKETKRVKMRPYDYIEIFHGKWLRKYNRLLGRISYKHAIRKSKRRCNR
ncbi:hypothetical protein HanXRQr2_Chr09g0372931 [Helianthus annuus]|uniref:Uncharacterized protein n=1 Tax=Helianthus annuus TaxID=4232 RepID=A0A9K3N7U8_HELAN|nr:hypothetical protein HanXRQr2_Chr09g0372931 [Helianthus annuus]KAJ0891887.1 hypothetical protein HanPSC8_Chr09g0359411 [Helianthus annuus]